MSSRLAETIPRLPSNRLHTDDSIKAIESKTLYSSTTPKVILQPLRHPAEMEGMYIDVREAQGRRTSLTYLSRARKAVAHLKGFYGEPKRDLPGATMGRTTFVTISVDALIRGNKLSKR